MLLFESTASVSDDIKVIARYVKKYGSNFHEHLNISKTDAIKICKELDTKYHSEDVTLVHDEVYDIFKDWVVSKWPESPYTKAVGAKPKSKLRKVRLDVPMPSQDKMKTAKDIDKFLDSDMYVLGDKLDGISLEIKYVDGVIVQVCTRGDGITGEETNGVIPALNVPHAIKVSGTFIVRAEFIIKRHTFAANHSKHDGTGDFVAARNMSGGVLRRNVPSANVSATDVVVYEIVKGKGAGQRLSLQLAILKKLGFTVVRHRLVTKLSEPLLHEYLDKFKKTAKYEIDGIIVTKDVSYTVSKNNPKHARAFKVNDLANAMTVPITRIEWRKSRHNRFAPRIYIDPIIIGGVEVKHFTGHNYFYIQNGFTTKAYNDAERKGTTLPVRPMNVGAMIKVVRSGDVIPYIVEVVKPARKASTPSEPFVLDARGVHAMTTVATKDIKKKRIEHFFSQLDVEGLKAGTIEKLYENGYNTIRKVFRVKTTDLLALEGFQETSAKKLIFNLKSVTENARFAQLGYASGIFGDKIGKSKLQDIIDAIPDIMALASKLSKESLEERIKAVKGIATTASVIAAKLPAFIEFVEKVGITIVPEPKKVVAGNKLSGIKILLTGVRDADLVKAVLANGGEEGSIKTATHVITKLGTTNKKTEYATENDIPILTVDDFRRKFKV